MTQPQSSGRIPGSYDPVPTNFQAPSHHLSKEQAAEVISLAEASHQDKASRGGGAFSGSDLTSGTNSGSSGLTGQSGAHSGTRGGIASTLGGGTGSATRSHTGAGGEYELGGNDLSHNRTALSGDSTNAAGLRQEGNRGGLTNPDNYNSSASHTGAGVLGGAGAAGAGAAAYGASHGHSNNTSSGGLGHSSGTSSGNTLQNKLQDELERNAKKSGTHATGFGTQGADSNLGAAGNTTSTGQRLAQEGSSALGGTHGDSSGLTGSHGSSGLTGSGNHGSSTGYSSSSGNTNQGSSGGLTAGLGQGANTSGGGSNADQAKGQAQEKATQAAQKGENFLDQAIAGDRANTKSGGRQ